LDLFFHTHRRVRDCRSSGIFNPLRGNDVRKIIIPVILALILVSCASGPSVDAYADGSLIAEQRAEIERLKRDITDMGAVQREVSERIDGIAAELANGLRRCETIEDIFAEIDRFVRELINENSKLRNLQRTDRGTDAGGR
jgi:chromosome segregation ATPase